MPCLPLASITGGTSTRNDRLKCNSNYNQSCRARFSADISFCQSSFVNISFTFLYVLSIVFVFVFLFLFLFFVVVIVNFCACLLMALSRTWQESFGFNFEWNVSKVAAACTYRIIHSYYSTPIIVTECHTRTSNLDSICVEKVVNSKP